MIKITYPFDKSAFIKKNKFIFSIEIRNSYIKFFIYLFLLVGLMILIKFDTSPASALYGISGIVLFILTCNYLIRILNARSLFFREINELAEKYQQQKFIHVIEFTEDEFIYIDNERKIYLKWQAFSKFSLKNDYFLLLAKKKIQFVIHRSEITEQEFTTIIELAKAKLSFIKL